VNSPTKSPDAQGNLCDDQPPIGGQNKTDDDTAEGDYPIEIGAPDGEGEDEIR